MQFPLHRRVQTSAEDRRTRGRRQKSQAALRKSQTLRTKDCEANLWRWASCCRTSNGPHIGRLIKRHGARIKLAKVVVHKDLLRKWGRILEKQRRQGRARGSFRIKSSSCWTRSARSCVSSITPCGPNAPIGSGSNDTWEKLYGTGMRLMECVRLRLKDVDFGQNQVVVREGKGFKDRVTVLPGGVKAPLAEHLKRVLVFPTGWAKSRWPRIARTAAGGMKSRY